jgi:hypothetical protein
VPVLIASVTCEFVTHRLDPSVGRSGPHDLAVRKDAFVGARALSIFTSTASRRLTSMTIAIRPSAEAGWGRINMYF